MIQAVISEVRACMLMTSRVKVSQTQVTDELIRTRNGIGDPWPHITRSYTLLYLMLLMVLYNVIY